MSFFCIKPWNELFIGKDGVQPCCFYSTPLDMSVGDYLNSDHLKRVKQQLLDGVAPPECRKCVVSEKNTGHSARILDNTFHPEIVEQIQQGTKSKKFGIVSVTTSNTCNLKCLSCDNSSYVRMLELKKLNLLQNANTVSNFEIITEKYQVGQVDFEKIILLGGEPFYDRVTFNILEQLVESKKSQDIVVELNTNGTHVTKEKLSFLSKNFKQVSLKFSIDGVGPINDYLRWPSEWNAIEQNINHAIQYENVSVMIVGTISNLSLLRWYEVIEWAYKKNIKDIFISPVLQPVVMSPNCLPQELKNNVVEKYQQLLLLTDLPERFRYCIDAVIGICQNQQHGDIVESINWFKRHDELRGNSLFELYPELLTYAKT